MAKKYHTITPSEEEFWEWLQTCPETVDYKITEDDDETVEITFWFRGTDDDKEATKHDTR